MANQLCGMPADKEHNTMKINDIFDLSKYDDAYKFVSENEGTTIEYLGDDKYKIVKLSTPSVEELSAQKRSERDVVLQSTDIYMLSDFPISDEQRELYKQYRQYLRDLPTAESFPEVKVMSFEEWGQWIGA